MKKIVLKIKMTMNVIVFNRRFFTAIWFLFSVGPVFAQPVGEVLSPWSEGHLDIHHINTGRGEAAFCILPDGTTLLVDAGEHARPPGPREVAPRPDASRGAGEWIARYINAVMKHRPEKAIDCVVLTHFDTDHIGGVTPEMKTSPHGGYKLTGVTEVAAHIPVKKIIDRAWPDYNWPKPLQAEHIKNYRQFVEWQAGQGSLSVERFRVGSNDQVTLLKNPSGYPDFSIRNIVANGVVWTGAGSGSVSHFPAVETLSSDLPSENMSSLGFKMSYGAFDYFTSGDLVGIPPAGSPEWQDIETPVARVVGPVDVSVANHHAFIDGQNAFYIKTLQPRVTVIQSWGAAHPAHSTLSRLMSERLYPGERDIFITNLKSETKLVLGRAAERMKSQQGHIVVRVSPGGSEYRIFILDDTAETFVVKAVHGPYLSR